MIETDQGQKTDHNVIGKSDRRMEETNDIIMVVYVMRPKKNIHSYFEVVDLDSVFAILVEIQNIDKVNKKQLVLHGPGSFIEIEQ